MMRAKASTISTALLLSILLFCSYQPISSLTNDGVSLLSFKYSILSDPLHVLDSWSSDNHTPCSWQGVSCSAPNKSDPPQVIGLSLPGSQLLGSIPANLTLLDQLQWFNLSSNSINGSIPESLFTLPNLRRLDLSENFISGDLPELVGNLRRLEVLDVSENALEGNIPRNLSKLRNLMTVSLRGNYFSGHLPGGFHRVKYLDLSSNLINGSLPVDLGGGSVEYINVSFNRITGEIPPEFGRYMPEHASLDFSSNYLTGEIPDSSVFRNQERGSFAGNSDLCGPPLGNPCPIPSSSAALPYAVDEPIPSPAIAVIPKAIDGHEAGSPGDTAPRGKNNNLRPQIILAIIVGDLIGIAIFATVFIYVCRRKKKHATTTTTTTTTNIDTVSKVGSKGTTPMMMPRPSLSRSSSSSSSSESKGLARWSCLNRKSDEDDEEEDDNDDEERQQLEKQSQQGQLVTVDSGERELELETLLKASAYILGASGSSIMYKAVLEDGTVLAVRRVGECRSAERFKDFESQVRAIAKMVHPNLVRVRGFYWASDEKLVIYEFVPNGNLANARYRKTGSSLSPIPWEIRLRIAKGVARGLSYIHDKKHVHGNLKPTNILLDSDMEPKIADFGFERLSMGRSGYIPAGSIRHFGSKRSTASRDSFHDYSTPSPSASSIGCISPYHSPETLRSLKPNPKWDVYSFGVVLLELLTGKVIVSDELGPPVLAVGLEDKTRVLRMADPAIRAELEGKEEDLFACLKLGYNCICHVPQKRPTMKEAVQVLEKIPTPS